MIVNDLGLKNGSRLTNSLRTSHASVVGNLGPKRGAKIHQTKMGCVSQTAFREQRSANTDRTSENQSQDAYHSAEDIRAAESNDETQPVLPRIKFPLAFDTEVWCMLDNIINKILHKELGNKDSNQWLNESSLVIYNVCMRIYGVKEKDNEPPAKKNRRQKMIQYLRMKKRNLKKQIRFANPEEKMFCLKSGSTSKKNTMLFARQKIWRRDGWNEGKSKNVFPGTIRIFEEHIWSTEIRRAQDGEKVLKKHLKDT